jgi:hypothetical protein
MTTTTTDYKPGDLVRLAVDHNDNDRGWMLATFVSYLDLPATTMVEAGWWRRWYAKDHPDTQRMAVLKFSDPICHDEDGVGTYYVDSTIEDVENIQLAKWYVRAYSMTQVYGGPEEGGWWFEAGDAVTPQIEVESREAAQSLREEMQKEWPTTGKRYSVLGGDDYAVEISPEPLEDSFPKYRPRYE